MQKLMGAARRRTIGVAAGLILTGSLVGGVLLTSGSAYAATATTTTIVGTRQLATSTGTTLTVLLQVSPDPGGGTVFVSAGTAGSCHAVIEIFGYTECQITKLAAGTTVKLTATFGGNLPGYSPSPPSAQVTVVIGSPTPPPAGVAPVFDQDSPPTFATSGQTYSYTFHATGTPTPKYALGAGSPSWLTIDPISGALSGTVPFGIFSFTYSVTATNTAGTASTGGFTVYVFFF